MTGKRVCSDWIQSFMDYTNPLPSPRIFLKWAAISAIAGALERKVWARTMKRNLYPHMYVILIADPGVGKSVVIDEVIDLWAGLEERHISAKNVSKASFVDELADAVRKIVRVGQTPPYVEYNSLLVPISELGVFITQYDNEFMSALTDLYDAGSYTERKRTTNKKIELEHVQLNLLSGTTPGWLTKNLPEGAWNQGFLSRTMLIFSGEAERTDPFDDGNEDNDRLIKEALLNDLKEIGELYGEFTFTPEGQSRIRDWHMGGGEPLPEHPRLQHYISRRTAHLLKLCMVNSVSRSGDLVIDLDIVQKSLNDLIEAEGYMGDIFKAMKYGGDDSVQDEIWHYLYKMNMKENKPMLETRLVNFVRQKTPAQNVDKIIDIMVRSGMIKTTAVNGFVAYQANKLEV